VGREGPVCGVTGVYGLGMDKVIKGDRPLDRRGFGVVERLCHVDGFGFLRRWFVVCTL
jgi:hypothetical protein